MNAKETPQKVSRSSDADVKQELIDWEAPDGSTETMDESITEISKEIIHLIKVPTAPEIKCFKDVKDDHSLMNNVIQQQPKSSANLELIKAQVGLCRVMLQRLPTYTHTDVKQEPMDVDEIDSDDVTTQLILKGREQHEIEDIKFVNTQDYLDIGETVISKQDRAISEQDSATPGPFSKDDERFKTNIHKNKETSLFAGRRLFECDICGYQCRQRRQIERHIRSHTEKKPYKCEICDCQFRQVCTLNKHLRTHTGEKPYKCDSCDYKCKRLSHLKEHFRTHSGEKPYKCVLCDYKCGYQNNLNRHMKTHTGEKPYKCKLCDYQCRKLYILKTHLRMHTGYKPYKCDLCVYKCGDKGNLKRHMKTHTGEKPYKCNICDHKCRELNKLKRHMRTHT